MKRVVTILLMTVLLLSAHVAAQAPATQLKAEVTWWSFPNFLTVDGIPGKHEQSIIKAFNAKYPNIKVNIEMIDFASGPEKIVTAIQGGTAPDVLFDAPGRIIDYGKNGVLANLNDMFTAEFIKDVNNKNVIDACKVGSNFYMYPISTAPFLMAFNKDMLQKHGLLHMLPTEGDRTWTTSQYTALLKALKAKNERGAIVFCISQGGDQGTRAFMANLFNSSITDAAVTKYTINDSNGVKGLQYVVDAIKDGLLLNGSASDGTGAIDEFCAQRVSHTILFSPGLQAVKQHMTNFEPIMAPYPSENGTPALEYLIDGFCVLNNGDANRIKAAKLLIDFICNDPVWGPKNVVATNTFPVRSSFGNLYKGDGTMTFLAGLTKYYAPYYNTINGFAAMRTAWFPALQAAFSGEKTAKKALDDFVKAANESIKR
ncbi:MAG: extracellular solute-binding protein [Clostridia bacterium]|nr:extracellular solute-binding protein [Clostridia bacterium]